MQAVARDQHPGFLKLLELDDLHDMDKSFMVQQLMEGRSLQEASKSLLARLDLREAQS